MTKNNNIIIKWILAILAIAGIFAGICVTYGRNSERLDSAKTTQTAIEKDVKACEEKNVEQDKAIITIQGDVKHIREAVDRIEKKL